MNTDGIMDIADKLESKLSLFTPEESKKGVSRDILSNEEEEGTWEVPEYIEEQISPGMKGLRENKISSDGRRRSSKFDYLLTEKVELPNRQSYLQAVHELSNGDKEHERVSPKKSIISPKKSIKVGNRVIDI